MYSDVCNGFYLSLATLFFWNKVYCYYYIMLPFMKVLMYFRFTAVFERQMPSSLVHLKHMF